MECTGYVSEVVDKNNKLPPIIVSFEHGDLKPSEVTDLRCSVLQNKMGDKQRMVAVATPHLQYISRASSDSLATTFLAVRNKKTNKVRLIETECFTLSPSIAKERNITADNDVADVKLQYAQLSKSFGSKMAKRKQEQIERTTINADNLEGQLAEVTQTMKVAEEDLNFSNDGLSSLKELLPPFNPEAITSSQVYELTNILSPDEIESLDVVCDEILVDPESYSRHSPSTMFTSCLPSVLASKDRTRLKALLYADCLIKFVCLTAKDLSKKDLLLCPYSVHISNNILNNFTVKIGNRRNRSMTQRDKALCYIIVMGLLACNFQLNLEPVMESLLPRISMKKLLELKRIVGAVSSKDSPNIVMLKVPLPSMKDINRSIKLSMKRK